MRDFKELKVWEKSHQIVLEIYRLTKEYPKDELYGLTSQMRRAAVSVTSNIVEGSARSSNSDFSRFLFMSLGSANELDYQLLLSKDLEYIDSESYLKLNNEIIEIKKMINAFINHLTANS